MATHSSVLAWRIPGMGEPGGLPSMGLHRVGHNLSNLAAASRDEREGCAVDGGKLWLQHYSSEVPGKRNPPLERELRI